MLTYGYDRQIVDLETAFLYDDCEEEIYMECSPGMNKKIDKILALKKSIYGCSKAVVQEGSVHFEEGFTGGSVDMRKNDDEENGLVLKAEDNLTDYLLCNIMFNEERIIAWIGQPHLIKKIEQKLRHITIKIKK